MKHFKENAKKALSEGQTIEADHVYAIRTLVLNRLKEQKASSSTKNDTTSFTCVTQPQVSGGPAENFVGWNGSVDIWENNSTINWTALSDTFPNQSWYADALCRLLDATQDWMNVLPNVKFQYVSKAEDAAFALRYGGEGGSTIARAFFPNAEDLNALLVYDIAFTPERLPRLRNTLQHEVGHILGLRHEFALEGETSSPVVLFGERNSLSIMSYDANRSIQDSDKFAVRTLYNLPNNSKIGDFSVRRIVPDN